MVDNNDNKKNNIKIIIIGDQAVGKSSLLMRYCEDKFTLNMMGTAGIDFKRKIIDYRKTQINVIFYDSAGHDRFRHIVKQHYQGAKGIILTYDVTDKNSFTNVNEWMNNIKENADSNAEIILIGNKIDLIEHRVVSTEEGLELSKKYEVDLFETSAKIGENTEKAFYSIIVKILENSVLNKEIKFKDFIESENEKKSNNNLSENNNNNKINIQPNTKTNNKSSGGCFKCG
jgi:Ras-related protein Rab-8A